MNAITKMTGDAIRPLGAMEEFIFLLKQIYSPSVVVGVEITGTVAPARLKSAFERICSESPHLQARARRSGQQRPHLFPSFPPTIGTFEVLPLKGAELNQIFANEMIKSFAADDVPVRAKLLHGEHTSMLVIAADHMMLDGRATAYLIEDILRAATEDGFGCDATMSVSQDGLLGLHVASNYDGTASKGEDISEVSRVALPVPAIEDIEIGPEEMQDLRHLARTAGTTFHGLLTAAILETGGQISTSWQDRPVTFTSVVDSRPLFDRTARLGCYISFASGEYRASQSPGIWNLAAAIRQGITEQTTSEAVGRQITGLQQALGGGVSPAGSVNLVGSFDLLVTNYGQLQIKREYKGLKIQKLMPHVIGPGVQTVSVATVGDDLHMSNVSFEPIPHLLQQTKARLLGLLRR